MRETTNYKCQVCGQIVYTGKYHPKECCESFKAGFDEGVRLTTDACDSTFGAQLKAERKEGRKEVVFAVNEFCGFHCSYQAREYWQAKLEQWGV